MTVQLHSLHLKNFVLFDDATLDFKEGITLISGPNRSGKSSLFSGLRPLLYNSGKNPVGSRVGLNWTQSLADESTRYMEVDLLQNKSPKYAVLRDGVDLKPHKLADARRLISNHWGLTEELFGCSFLLSGTRTPPLVEGKPSAKSEWLQSILGLATIYDDKLAQIEHRLTQLKDAIVKQRTLQEERDTLELPKEPHPKKKQVALEETVLTIKKKLKSLPESMAQLQKDLSSLEARLLAPDGKIPSTKNLQKELSGLRSDLSDLKQAKKKAEKKKEVQRLVAKAKDFVTAHEKTPSVKVLKKQLKKAKKEHNAYETSKGSYDKQASDREEWATLESKGRPKKTESTPNKHRDSASHYRKLGQSLGSLSGSGQCPTCDQSLKKIDVSGRAKEYSKQADIEEALADRAELREDYDRLASIKWVSKPKKPTTDSPKKIKAQIDISTRLEAAKAVIASAGSYEDIEKPSISKDATKKRIGEIEKELYRIASQKHALRSVSKEHRDLSRKEAKGLLQTTQETLGTLEEQNTKLVNALDEAQRQIGEYKGYRSIRSSVKSKMSDLDDRIGELKKTTKDQEPLLELKKACGPQGVRLTQIQEAAHIFGAKLSEISRLMFNEAYKFSFVVEPRKLDIQVERQGTVGGLADLSGSETRVWTILCAMSLLHLIPASRRTDTIILDELEANLDGTTRLRYTKELLPELQSMVPKVVVVTPLIDGELRLKPDHAYRIEPTNSNGQVTSKLLKC